jgi:L-ascorbate metabolism protein UlaG (beta-lactamase superfamily)
MHKTAKTPVFSAFSSSGSTAVQRLIPILVLVSIASLARAETPTEPRAQYLANGGVMIENGDTKILFDPLFRNDYGQYDLVPSEMEAALFEGSPPMDGVDAIFISHHHGDHFDARLVLQYLKVQDSVHLYAPEQAVGAIQSLLESADEQLLARLHGLALERGDQSVNLVDGALQIDAIRIPHAGWPDRYASVENLVFRVTLDETTTVMHFGDADPDIEHYDQNPDHWGARHTDLAMPPYWFFASYHGKIVLEKHIRAGHSIGIHVPNQVPDDPADRPQELAGFDLFTQPGETRVISTQN